jgi:putative ABC transport system permease protein
VGSGPHINGVLVRTAGGVNLAPAIRRIVSANRADLPFTRVAPFSERFRRQIRPWQLGATLLVVFGTLAAAVAGVGLYAAFAHAVSARRRELAVRIALGATGARIRWLVLRDAAALTALGAAAGGIAAVWAGGTIEAMLFGITAADPVVLGAAGGAMLLLAFTATAGPAINAARADPASLLRAD